jgi:hypothetical protein
MLNRMQSQKRFLVLVFLSLLIGCGHKGEHSKLAVPAAAGGENRDRKATRQLAYEHSVQLEVPAEKIPAMVELVQSKCEALVAESCAVLDSRVTSERYAHARIKIRAKPAGVQAIASLISKEGEITQRSTSAEDLAQPIADTTKQLEMLTDYRARLEALRVKAVNDVDALIKINKELATVQSELEAASGRNAHFQRRVSTEILDISMQSRSQRSFWAPVSEAVADFGINLSQGLSFVVNAMAYLLPWIALLVFVVYVWRKSKNRRLRQKN